MTRFKLLAASAVVAIAPYGAAAQTMDHNMPGMTMPMPAAKPKPKPNPPVAKSKPKPVPAKKSPTPTTKAMTPIIQAPAQVPPSPAPALQPQAAPPPEAGAATQTGQMDHAAMGHDMAAMPGMPTQGDDMAGMAMGPGGDAYATGSGTSRLPANGGAMHGVHFSAGDWALMLHGYAWGVYTDQCGPRGDREAFVQSMAMLTASRDIGDGAHLQLRSMLSLEPLMGARGYPNLFATGETANGTDQLIDRQHPHDLFMELSARVDIDVAEGRSVFLYGGPVAEPALGPSAFMHRGSAKYQPLSPITHHWFDSTHISFGVVTAGYATPHFQIEGSAFRGREPDQHRWDIERPSLDSWSVRGTWTPSPSWALQVSHGRLKSPEQLEPFRNEARTTASISYAKDGLATTFAYSRKNKLPGPVLSAFLAEANWDVDAHHSIFARAENVANDELFPSPIDPLHDRKFRVSKLEGGYAYRLPVAGPVTAAIGGAVGIYAKPAELDAAYGKFPLGFSLFVKIGLGH